MGKRFMAAAAAFALSCAGASGQSYPGDSGAGTQRGVGQLNNSGQVGTVTLFRHDAHTRIRVVMDGTAGRTETARLFRGADCDALDASRTFILADLKNGVSRTDVNLSEDRLLSGNYNLVVLSSNRRGARMLACGHLYQ